MAAEGGDGRKRRRGKYISHDGKRKSSGSVPFGIQGFVITCDGGRESSASKEAINLLDEFYGRLLKEKIEQADIKDVKDGSTRDDKVDVASTIDGNNSACQETRTGSDDEAGKEAKKPKHEHANQETSKQNTVEKVRSKNIDELLEEEIHELQDKKKARFMSADTGCAGVIFIKMLKEGTVGPVELAEYVVRTIATSKKCMSRYCLKLLPVDVTCYASPAEVKTNAETHLLRHFPSEPNEDGLKFAVMYEARANSGLDRMNMIDAVAKLIPKPHSVDLKSPDKTIIVQVMKTCCAIGVVRGFKELAKYNIRQLTSQNQAAKNQDEAAKNKTQVTTKIVFTDDDDDD